jgi:rhodanese-related sulfurtransferase
LIARLAPSELAAWRADTARPAPLIVDVREPWEYQRCHIEGSQLVPLGQLPAHLSELPDDRDIVLVCHHGNRSMHAAMWLSQNGFARVHNLEGGIDAWAQQVEPSMPRY